MFAQTITRAVFRSTIGWTAVLFLSLTSAPFAGASTSSTIDTDRQSELLLKAFVFASQTVPNYGALVARLPRAEDRAYLQREFASALRSPVKIEYLDRNTLLIFDGADKIPVQLKNLKEARYAIFKHDYRYNPQESAQQAIARLQPAFTSNSLSPSPLELIFPRANAGPVATLVKWGVKIYVSVAAFGAVTCINGGWNSVGKCVEGGLRWGEGAAVGSFGLALLAWQNTKDHFTSKTFDLTDVHCPAGGDGALHATVLDQKGEKISVDMFYKADSMPDHIVFKKNGVMVSSLYFKADFSVATEGLQDKRNLIEGSAADLVAEGARNLNLLCQGDAKVAIENYLAQQSSDKKILPSQSSPTAVIK